MLNQTQLQEIKEHLEKAQNPLFFFDNDVDGLCSFLILQRAIGRGKGVAIKSFPDLNMSYLRKIDELNPDYVFILDKPVVSNEFIEGVLEKNIPLVWIDHHEVKVDEEILDKIDYYNSFPSSEPTTYLAYNVFKNDMWLAMIGCIGDVYMPDFAEEFSEKNPELFKTGSSAFDSLYTTEVGKIVKMLNFGLKDTTTHVVNLIKFLMKAKNIHDVFEENHLTKQLHYRYKQLNEIYEKLLGRAEEGFDVDSKVLLFEYGGDTSMSSEIANELCFKHKDKFVVVAYKRNDKVNISIRGEDAKKLTLKLIEGIDGATGGGHEKATGAQVPEDNWEEFKERLVKLI